MYISASYDTIESPDHAIDERRVYGSGTTAKFTCLRTTAAGLQARRKTLLLYQISGRMKRTQTGLMISLASIVGMCSLKMFSLAVVFPPFLIGLSDWKNEVTVYVFLVHGPASFEIEFKLSLFKSRPQFFMQQCRVLFAVILSLK